MSETLEPKLRTYTGTFGFVGEEKAISLPGLMQLARGSWPDLKFPADLVLLPLEDFSVILADATGQVMTPTRNPACLHIQQIVPVKPVKSSFFDLWYWPLILALAWTGALTLVEIVVKSL